ncbi:MAG TPA: hypothetical protein ENH49_00470 [Candidatus Marinimicrobia bacterium]|nr:hypothetical protein [Candidatus Neomarinimicrobiota bacterium]
MNQINLCERIRGSLRHIIIDDGKKVISSGTGTIINKNGLILTAKHVVASGGKFYQGQLIVTSPGSRKECEYQYSSNPKLAIDINHPDLLKPVKKHATPNSVTALKVDFYLKIGLVFGAYMFSLTFLLSAAFFNPFNPL